VAGRFEALGWHTVCVDDANDLEAIKSALKSFQAVSDRPTLIIVRSVIAYGAPNKANTHGAHGAPLGEDEIRLTKAAYGWTAEEPFFVPVEVREHFATGIGSRGRKFREEWESRFADYQAKNTKLASQITDIQAGRLPLDWDADLPTFEPDGKGIASRVSSGKMLNKLAGRLPWLVGGSADLAPSTMTMLVDDEAGDFSARNRGGRNFHFGVREHTMAAIGNGLSLAGLRPYVATFFVFSDYLRPSMRLSAFMHRPVIYIFTHDSIGLGEDGPTHQPIEHLAACRAIPNLIVARPADANEVAEIYRTILTWNNRPTALVLSRQQLPTLDRSHFLPAAGAARGAYVLSDPDDGQPQLILIGTGSEVSLCVAAQQKLARESMRVRVVSMPSWELFDEQDESYRESVLPPAISARVAVEAGSQQGWERYIGAEGRFVGISSFGASAPYKDLYHHFGITVERIVEAARSAL